MIFGAKFRIFHELSNRTFKIVIDSDYDYQNRGGTVIGDVNGTTDWEQLTMWNSGRNEVSMRKRHHVCF